MAVYGPILAWHCASSAPSHHGSSVMPPTVMARATLRRSTSFPHIFELLFRNPYFYVNMQQDFEPYSNT